MGKESGEVARWEFPGFVQEKETHGDPRFHLFVFEFDQQWNEGAG